MMRCVEPELLDELPPNDAGAIRARRDLRRLNALMRHAAIVGAAMAEVCSGRAPRRLVELGAGDGGFALGLARKLAPLWPALQVVLVDRQNIVSDRTRRQFHQWGWNCEPVQADVFDWFTRSGPCEADCLVANLFLHHFTATRLRNLLALAAGRAEIFIACEPRRTRTVLRAGRWVGLVGCNRVTRHDAVVSVRAGFVNQELSELWPQEKVWQVQEREAGLFSHLFVARRAAGHPSPCPLPSTGGTRGERVRGGSRAGFDSNVIRRLGNGDEP